MPLARTAAPVRAGARAHREPHRRHAEQVGAEHDGEQDEGIHGHRFGIIAEEVDQRAPARRGAPSRWVTPGSGGR